MKYLVMECHLSYAVVLDENGRFLKAANQNYQVGQTVTDIVAMQLPQQKPRAAAWVRQLSAVAACLVLIVGAFLFLRLPYASVYITINPEVRIDVNRSDRVVGVEGVNDDGLTLLEGYSYRGKMLDLVMDELVDRAIDMGYLHEGGKVNVSLDANTQWVTDHTNTLTDHLNQHLGDRISVIIDIDELGATDYSDYGELPDPGHVTVPVQDDGHSQYHVSDYGTPYEATEAETPYDIPETETPYEAPEAETPYEPTDTPYGHHDDGHTDYDQASDYDDPQTDYDDSHYHP